MANFRPLQPAPLELEEPAQPQSKPSLTQKPKRTVTLGACVACRRRKSKCDGARPTCTCCEQKDTECIYELGPHEKPSQALKRKNEEMQGELSNLRQLYDYLRVRPEHEAFEIVRQIRANAPDTNPSQRIKELAGFLSHRDIGPPSTQPSCLSTGSNNVTLPPLRMALHSYLEPVLSSSSSFPLPPDPLTPDLEGPLRQRRRYGLNEDVSTRSASQGALPRGSINAIMQHPHPLTLQRPVDPRLGSVVNWTSVTDDKDLVVQLMSAWYKWEYKYYHFLDWESFLDDMASGRTDFCSKLLVNALLASASFHSPLVNDRSKPFSNNLITSFYKEARLLWEIEEGRDSLTKLQAALLIYLVIGKNGRDRAGHVFLVEACRIAQDMGLFGGPTSAVMPTPIKPQGASLDIWRRSCAVTTWALFNFQLSMSGTGCLRVIITSLPPVPIPYSDKDSEALFFSECLRQVIMLDVSAALCDADIEDSDIPPAPELVETLYLRLDKWWHERPSALDPNKNPSSENLVAAMMHYASNIRLVQPFLLRDKFLSRVQSYHARAHSIFATSLKHLRRLLTLHEVCHGWTNAIAYVLHPIMVTGFGSLDEIISANLSHMALEMSEPYLGLLTCLRALSAISNFIYYAQPLFRLLTQACQAADMKLPSEVLRAEKQYQSEEWTRSAKGLVSSRYVADMSSAVKEMESRRLDTVIAQWDALTISEKSQSEVEHETPTSENDAKRYMV